MYSLILQSKKYFKCPDPDEFPGRAWYFTKFRAGRPARVARGRGSRVTDFVRGRGSGADRRDPRDPANPGRIRAGVTSRPAPVTLARREDARASIRQSRYSGAARPRPGALQPRRPRKVAAGVPVPLGRRTA